MRHLRDIATIRMGYTYRGSLKEATGGDTGLIQMRDVSPEGLLRGDALASVDAGAIAAHYFLRGGDLIFRSRGLENTVALVENPLPRMVCVAPLMCIRIERMDLVLPAYLHWFINLAATRKAMDAYARGVTVRMIPAGSMEGLPLVVPPLERQRKIIEVAQAYRRIRELEAGLAEKNQSLHELSLLQYAKGLSV